MTQRDEPVKQQVVSFAGYDHSAVPREGYLYDMENLCLEDYPALSVRRGRRRVRTLTKPNGLFCKDRLCWVDGTGFYYDGVLRGTVADSPKQFGRLGSYVIIFPDKYCYNTETGVFAALEAHWSGTASITHYTWDAESLEAGAVYAGNAITTAGGSFPFEVGEAVFVAGSTIQSNNRSAVIRGVADGGRTLVFSNNSFQEAAGQGLTLQRKVPDMDFFCENENRLWGCKGNEIYASALGNPFRWNNYEGAATDSYAVRVGSDGAFTGAASFLGYAMFFKPDAIHKIYGGKPSNFQAMSSAVSGVAAGSAASVAIAGETLFYLCRTGIVSYSGGVPVSISAPFGAADYAQALGGSNGRKYYVSMRTGAVWHLFVYDTRTGMWCREDSTQALGFAAQDGVLYLLDARDNGLYALEDASSDGVSWYAETGDFTDNGADHVGVGKLQLRLETDAGSSVRVALQFDSDGIWRTTRVISAGRKQTQILPLIPRRCDHYRIRISGVGGCRMFSLTRQFYRGSERRSTRQN